MLQAHSSSSPAAWGEAPGGAGCPPAAHGSHTEQISTLQPVEEPPVEQVDVAWRRPRPVESPHRSRPGLDWNRLCWASFARDDHCGVISLSFSQPLSPFHPIFSPFP